MNALLEQNIVHVVIAIIENVDQEVLVSKRKPDAHLGGLLEFPGGKVEVNETPVEALQRELEEEVNIESLSFSPLIQIPFSYSDRKIILDAYLVNDYSGIISANERQEIHWKKIPSLDADQFPAANHGVIRALQLPKLFSVTPDYSQNSENFLINFKKVVSNQVVKIIQLRAHELDDTEYLELARQCVDICKDNEVKLILNRDVGSDINLDISGVHLRSDVLLKTKKRPLTAKHLVGASCHNKLEVDQASKLGLDYIFIGPVIEKNFSENSETLAWPGFFELAKRSSIPAYAIGGLNKDDVDECVRNGGQGIAAIRSIWLQ